jgi:hypothetical protein
MYDEDGLFLVVMPVGGRWCRGRVALGPLARRLAAASRFL